MKNAALLFCIIFAFRQGSDYDNFFDATEEYVKRYLPQVEALVEKIVSLINQQQ